MNLNQQTEAHLQFQLGNARVVTELDQQLLHLW